MRVPGVIFASEALLPSALGDRSLWQVANVATLPGIVKASYAMPDIHWGYGFPIGGVAATDVERGGVVSPGGVGFDISCGVRLLATTLKEEDVRPRLHQLMADLYRRVPAGSGAGGICKADDKELGSVLRTGARAAVEAGYGNSEDLERCEDEGGLPVDDLREVSDRATQRGLGQLGSLGSGNHFIEAELAAVQKRPQVGTKRPGSLPATPDRISKRPRGNLGQERYKGPPGTQDANPGMEPMPQGDSPVASVDQSRRCRRGHS
jgi:tRNA-splicing ligase RtcB (3'-phosphate/5'-hydroxy nucleic acid ligase)